MRMRCTRRRAATLLAGSGCAVWALTARSRFVAAAQATPAFAGDPQVFVPAPAEFADWQQIIGTKGIFDLSPQSQIIGRAPLQYDETFKEPGTVRSVSFSAKVWPSVDAAQTATYTAYNLDARNRLEIPSDITTDDVVAGTLAGPGSSPPSGWPFGIGAARIGNVWLVVSVYDKPEADSGQIIDWLRQAVTDAQQADWTVAPFDWDHAQPDVPRPWLMEPAAGDLPSGWEQRRSIRLWNDAGERIPRASAYRDFIRRTQQLRVRVDAYEATETAVAAYGLLTLPPRGASSFPATGLGDQATGYGAAPDPTAPITIRQVLHIQRGPLVATVDIEYSANELSDDAARNDVMRAGAIVDTRARASLGAAAPSDAT